MSSRRSASAGHALKPRLVVDWLPVDQQTLDCGAARRRNGCDHSELALVATVFKLPAFPLRNEITFNAVVHPQAGTAAIEAVDAAGDAADPTSDQHLGACHVDGRRMRGNRLIEAVATGGKLHKDRRTPSA